VILSTPHVNNDSYVAGIIVGTFVLVILISRQCTETKFFTMRCYVSAVYAVIVCLSICLSQGGFLLKWLNLVSCTLCCTAANGLLFCDALLKFKCRHSHMTKGHGHGHVINFNFWAKLSVPIFVCVGCIELLVRDDKLSHVRIF